MELIPPFSCRIFGEHGAPSSTGVQRHIDLRGVQSLCSAAKHILGVTPKHGLLPWCAPGQSLCSRRPRSGPRRLIVYLRAHSWFANSVGLDKSISTHTHHYNTTQSSFAAPDILGALPAPRPHPALAATGLFTGSVLPLPEYHTAGIIQYVAVADWLLSLGKMHLKFLHVFSWLGFISFWH